MRVTDPSEFLTESGEELVTQFQSVIHSQQLTVEEQAHELTEWIARFYEYNTSGVWRVKRVKGKEDFETILIRVAEIMEPRVDQLSEYATDKLIMYISFVEMLAEKFLTKSYPSAKEFLKRLQYCRVSLVKKMMKLDNGSWLENQKLLLMKPYFNSFKRFLEVRCRNQNTLEKIEAAQLFVRSIFIQCNLSDLYDYLPDQIRWDSIWSNLKESQRRMVLKYAIMPQESRIQPAPLDPKYIFRILESDVDMDYFLDIFRYMSADALKDFYYKPFYSNHYSGHNTLLPIIKRCLPSAEQLNKLFTLLNQKSAPDGFIYPIVDRIVGSLLESNKNDSEEKLLVLTTDEQLSQYIINGFQQYQYTTSRPIEMLSTVLVTTLSDEQIGRLIGFQSARSQFVDVVAKLARCKDCTPAAIEYFAKCATEMHSRDYNSRCHNKGTYLLKLLSDTNSYGMIPDTATQKFLLDWLNKHNQTVTSYITRENASQFITAHVPDVGYWEASNVYSFVLVHIFDLFSRNMSKDRKREWLNRLNFSHSVSRQSAVQLLYRVFYLLNISKPIPEVLPWEVINSDERIRELLQRDFNQFSERVKNLNFGYTEWTSIINENLLFEQLADFCDHVVTLEDRQEICGRFEKLFAKLENFTSILHILVNYLNVNAKKELSDIQDVMNRKNDVLLSNIEKFLSSIQDTLKPLLDLGINNLYAVLRSKLFILRYNKLSKGVEVSVRNSANLIRQVIDAVVRLLTSNETSLNGLELDSIVLLETFFEDVSREREFLEQIKCNPDRFTDAMNLHLRLQFLRNLDDIVRDEEIGFHPTIFNSNEYKQLKRITSEEILLKDASLVLDTIRDLTCFGDKEKAYSKTIYTWPVFSDVKQCKDLYLFCSVLSNRPDDARKQIILQKLEDGFESRLFLNYFESMTFLTPFMNAREGSVSMRQFFEALCDWDIESVEASRQFKCLLLCNGQNEIERIKEILEKTSRDEQTLAEKAIEMISTGEFKIRLRTKCSFSVTYTDKKSRQCECYESEFRDILNNSMFKRDSSEALGEFSMSASLLITIFESFVKLNVTGHVAFQNADLILPMDDMALLKDIARRIPVFADDWEVEITKAYAQFKHLVSFNTKQILLLSQFLNKALDDKDMQFYQILYSCFDVGVDVIDEERDNAQQRLIQRPEYNWSLFETTRVSISTYVASIFNLVGEFLQRIASRVVVDSFNYAISRVSPEQFHDISNLDRVEQLIYLLHLSSRSRDILICKETTTDIELSFKLRIHEKLAAGRIVLFGADKLSTPVSMALMNYLMRSRNTPDKQIICLLIDGSTRTALPSFLIHSVPVLLADVKTEVLNRLVHESRKFSKCEYYDMYSGSGKTYTIHKKMDQHVPNDNAKLVVDINNSTSIDEIISRLSKPLHSHREGAIYINFSHDVDLSYVSQILIEMMVLGSISSSETGKVLTVPKICQENWQVFIEIPAMDDSARSKMTESLYPLPLFAAQGQLLDKFELTERAILTISFIHHFLTATGRFINHEQPNCSNKYPVLSEDASLQILNSIIQNHCKSIPLSFHNHYSYRTLSHFLAFMSHKCLDWLNEDYQFQYNEMYEWTLPRTFVKLFLFEADNFLNPRVQHNRYQKSHTYVYSIKPRHATMTVVPFKNTDLHSYSSVATAFSDMESIERRAGRETTGQRVLDLNYMQIDYKLVEFLASALNAEEKQVSMILDKHKYVLIPEYLHKLIQINQRLGINLSTIVEGDSGTGKTKLVELYAEIMTSSHCDAVQSLKDFILSFETKTSFNIRDECEVTTIVDNVEQKQIVQNYLYNIFNESDCQAIFDVMRDIDNLCPSREFKETAINRLCDYAVELFNPIFDRAQTVEDKAIRTGAKGLLGGIKNLECSERIATLQHVIELVIQQGRAFLSRTVISKIEQVIRTDIVETANAVMMNNQRSLKEHLLSILNKNRQVDALINYLEYTLSVCPNRAQLLDALVTNMTFFITEHPLVKPPIILEQFLANPDRDNNQFLDMVRLYLSMDRHSSFISVLMHSALSSKDMLDKLARFLELAERADSLSEHQKCQHCGGCANFVGFIDEANTTKLMGMLSTLLVDHRWSEYSFTKRLPKNISWICAINPYDSNEDKSKRRFYVQEESVAMKSFKFFWDQLDKQQMKEYIQAKISLSKTLYTLNLTETKVRALRKLIMKSHQHVAKVIQEDKLKSTVSQRDIHRVFQLLEWFYARNDMKHDLSRPDRLKFSALMAIAFCYYFRLTSERRSEFSNVIMGLTTSLWGTGINLTELVNNVMDYFVDQMEVPPSIFKNYALKQNMFTLMVCIENRIPITLIGPPGCSKTLSLQIVYRNMGRKGFMKTFQQIDSIHRYQGSRQSTSEEIEKVCIKALESQLYFDEHKVKKLALFFFDEAGIPESEKESLKVLHYYLNNAKFPSVLITNDPLDVAKSNRGIEILLSKPDEGDLVKLAEGIIKRHENDNLTPETIRILEACCKAYKSLINDKTNIDNRKPIRDWIGMRDFYHLIRFIRRKSTGLSIDITPQLLLQGLERNFNGLKASTFKKIVNIFFSECHKVNPAFNPASNLNYRLNLEILKDSLLDINRGQDLGNLNDTCVRFKLVVDETLDNSLASILLETGVIDTTMIEQLTLSDFASDKNDMQRILMVSKTIAAMESGKTTLMTNTRSIDGSFYDLYNQYYQVTKTTDNDNEYLYFTTIAVGAVSEYRRVHKDFQCIVHISASEAKNLEPALLNRFEKYSISVQDALLYKRRLLSETQNKNLDIVVDRLKGFAGHICNNYKNVIFTSDLDSTIASLILPTISANGTLEIPKLWYNSSIVRVDEVEHAQVQHQRLYLQTLLTKLVQIVRPEGFVLNMRTLPDNYMATYFKDQHHLDMKQFLQSIMQRVRDENDETSVHKYMIYTPQSRNIQTQIPKELCEVVQLEEIHSRDHFIDIATKFCNSDQKMFVLFVSEANPLVHQVRNIIDNELEVKDKKAFIILSNFRQDKFSVGVQTLFLSGWDNFYIDGNANKQLEDYILEICSEVEILPDPEKEWGVLESLLVSAMRKLQFPSTVSIQSDITAIYTGKSVESRAACLRDVLNYKSLQPLKANFIEIARRLTKLSFRTKILQSQAASILNNEVHMNLAEHVQSMTNKAYTALLSKIMHQLLDRLHIISTWNLRAEPDLCEYLMCFINTDTFGSIEEIVNNVADRRLEIIAENYVPNVPFSREIVEHVKRIILEAKSSIKEHDIDDPCVLLDEVETKVHSSSLLKVLQLLDRSHNLRKLLTKDCLIHCLKHMITSTSECDRLILDVAHSVLLCLQSTIFGSDPTILSVLVLCDTHRELLETLVTSIKPLIDFKIINIHTLQSLDQSLDQVFSLEVITEKIDDWMLQVLSESLRSLLDNDTVELTSIMNWSLCTAAVFSKHLSATKSIIALQTISTLLRNNNAIPHAHQRPLLHSLLGNFSAANLEYAVNSFAQSAPEENKERLASSSMHLTAKLYKTTRDPDFLRLVLRVVNGTHPVLRHSCRVSCAMGGYIVSSLLYDSNGSVVDGILNVVYDTISEAGPFVICNYLPIYFTANDEPISHHSLPDAMKSPLCKIIYDMEANRINNVSLQGLVNRLDDEKNRFDNYMEIDHLSKALYSTILQCVLKVTIIERAGKAFAEKKLFEQFHHNSLSTLESILHENKNYQLMFLNTAARALTRKEFADLMLDEGNRLDELNMAAWVNMVRPITLSSTSFSFMQDPTHARFDLYHRMKTLFVTVAADANEMNQLIQFLTDQVQQQPQNLYHFRMFLVCIAHSEFYKKSQVCPNPTGILQQLNMLRLTQNEQEILCCLLSITTLDNNNCIANQLCSVNDYWNDNLFNFIALIFGMPQNTYLYNLLFNIGVIENNYVPGALYRVRMKGSGAHRGYLDCGTKVLLDGTPEWGQPLHLGINTLYLLYFMTFGMMAVQLQFMPDSLPVFHDQIFSAAADSEIAPDNLTKMRQFVLERTMGHWLHYWSKCNLSADQSQRLITLFVEDLQTLALSGQAELQWPVIDSEARLNQYEQFIQARFALLFNNKPLLDLPNEQQANPTLLELLENYNSTLQQHQYSIGNMGVAFYSDPNNAVEYPILALYFQNTNRFELSNLLCYCAELYVWISNSLTGLLQHEDLQRPVSDIIARYKLRETEKGNMLMSLLRKLVKTWNKYIDIFNGFDYECHLGEVKDTLTNDVQLQFLLSFTAADKAAIEKQYGIAVESNSIFAAMVSLANIHNEKFVKVINDNMARLGYPVLCNEINMYLLNSSNADQYMFHMEKNFDGLCQAHVTGPEMVNWRDLQDQILSTMLYKPKIEIPQDQLMFKLRDLDALLAGKESENTRYVDHLTDDLKEEISEYIQLQIQQQYHDLDREQILGVIDSLKDLINAERDIPPQTKLQDVLDWKIPGVTMEQSVLDLSFNQVGSLLQIFVDKSNNLDYNYRQLDYAVKKRFTADQLQELQKKITIFENDTELITKLQDLHQTLLQSEPYLKHAMDGDLIEFLAYAVEIEDSMQIIFEGLSAEYYVSIQQFLQKSISHYIKLKTAEYSDQTVWREFDSDVVVHVEEKEQPVATDWYAQTHISEVLEIGSQHDEDEEVEVEEEDNDEVEEDEPDEEVPFVEYEEVEPQMDTSEDIDSTNIDQATNIELKVTLSSEGYEDHIVMLSSFEDLQEQICNLFNRTVDDIEAIMDDDFHISSDDELEFIEQGKVLTVIFTSPPPMAQPRLIAVNIIKGQENVPVTFTTYQELIDIVCKLFQETADNIVAILDVSDPTSPFHISSDEELEFVQDGTLIQVDLKNVEKVFAFDALNQKRRAKASSYKSLLEAICKLYKKKQADIQSITGVHGSIQSDSDLRPYKNHDTLTVVFQ